MKKQLLLFAHVLALYGATLLGANVALADVETAASLREGTLLKLRFEDTPQSLKARRFQTFEGAPTSFDAYGGKLLVVNFWATWCGPCRREMPGLDLLAAELGGEDFDVITIAAGRNDPMAMQHFFEEIGVRHLPLYRDPQFELAKELGMRGLPYTVLINPEGQMIARLEGDAHWDSESARAVIKALLDQ